MRFAQPGQLESQLVANFEYNTSMQGGSRPAYVPVCASGSQALTIHYVENNRPIKAGEMVLLDAGCEWGGYASDITRKLGACLPPRQLETESGAHSGNGQALFRSAAASRRRRSTCTRPSSASKRRASSAAPPRLT